MAFQRPSPDDVLFIDDVARVLKTSRSTIEVRRRHGTFPIPELPAIDKRPRWSAEVVRQFIDGQRVTGTKLRRVS